jgi:hypothetical protein
MRKLWIQIFLLPNLRSAAAYLRSLDADTVGSDDEVAEAIDFAVNRLENWLNQPEKPIDDKS